MKFVVSVEMALSMTTSSKVSHLINDERDTQNFRLECYRAVHQLLDGSEDDISRADL